MPAPVSGGMQAHQIGAKVIDATHVVDHSLDALQLASLTDLLAYSSLHIITDPKQLVHKGFVDNALQGLKGKKDVKAMSDADVASLSGLPADIDGVTSWSAGDRVLLIAQTDPIENGVWEVQSGAWTRPADFPTAGAAANAYCFVDQGGVYAAQGWMCNTDAGADVIGTDSLAWNIFTRATDYQAGDGIKKIGSSFAVKPDHTSTGTDKANAVHVGPAGVRINVDNQTIGGSMNGLGAVEDLVLLDGAVTTDKVGANAITEPKMGSDSVNGKAMKDDAFFEYNMFNKFCTQVSGTNAGSAPSVGSTVTAPGGKAGVICEGPSATVWNIYQTAGALFANGEDLTSDGETLTGITVDSRNEPDGTANTFKVISDGAGAEKIIDASMSLAHNGQKLTRVSYTPTRSWEYKLNNSSGAVGATVELGAVPAVGDRLECQGIKHAP